MTQPELDARGAAYRDKMQQMFGKPKLLLFGKDQTPDDIVAAIKAAHEETSSSDKKPE